MEDTGPVATGMEAIRMQPESVRKFIRYPDSVRVQPPPGESRAGAATRATHGGICFATRESLDAGTVVQLSLGTPAGEERLLAKVAWSQPGDGEFLTGARLLDDGDACRARLAAQLCLIDAYRRTERAGGRDLDEETAAGEWIARYAHQVPAIS